jgi:transcriptional regulator with XRE-family HTH domain
MSLFKNIIDGIPSITKRYVNRQVGFASTVAEKLRLAGMSQRELAEKLGKKESYISRVLSGDANPTLKTISELEIALGTDVISFNLQKQKAKSSSVIMFGESFRVILTGDDKLKAA